MAITQNERPRRSEKRKRTEFIAVRMTKAERAEFEQLAAAFGVSLSSFLRESAQRRRGEAPPMLPISA